MRYIAVLTLFRGQEMVTHYQVTVRGDEYDFGFITFPNLKGFVDHFNSQPIIAGKSGKNFQLKFVFCSNFIDTFWTNIV